MKEKYLWTLNFALVLIALLLVLNFFGIGLPSLGKAYYWLDKSEPVCLVSFKGEKALISMDACCSGLPAQLRCESKKAKILVEGKEKKTDRRCYTGPSAVEYLVNNKAYYSCQKEGYLR